MDYLPGISWVKWLLGISSEDTRKTFARCWDEVGTIRELYIYPLEGCQPKLIRKGFCTPYGIAEVEDETRETFLDRSFVIYTEETKVCKTLADFSHIVCLVMDSQEKGTFNLHLIDDDAPKSYPYPNIKTAKKVQVVYHGKNVKVYDCGDEIAQFLSLHLLHQEKGVRLGLHCNLKRRDISDSELKNANINFKTVEAKKMHADLSSCLFLVQSSIDDILYNIPNFSITAQSFRPNIVVKGRYLTGFPEDNWEWIKINEVVFHKTRLCTHTDTPTINMRTGIKFLKNEVIENINPNRLSANVVSTLVEENIPVVGVNAEIGTTGEIAMGNKVWIAP